MKTSKCLLVIALALLTYTASAQTRVFVKAGATGSGASWADATGDLKAAIDAAAAGTEIWVAAGTYKPTSGANRNISFALKQGVSMYGGFAGDEDPLTFELNERDIIGNETILTGDLQGNDNTNVSNSDPTRNDNSFALITAVNTDINGDVVVDGFTLTGANGVAANTAALTLRADDATPFTIAPSFRNCKFVRNSGNRSAVLMSSGNGTISPSFVNCSFFKNVSASSTAIYMTCTSADGAALPQFINCNFISNGDPLIRASSGLGLINTEVHNSIFVSGQIGIQGANTTVTISHSLFDRSKAAVYNNPGIKATTPDQNIYESNPAFVDAAAENYSLQSCSPAVNSGNNDALPAALLVDYTNNPRIFNDEIVDMGPHEHQGAATSVVFVNSAATGNNTGGSWADAFTDLNSALSSFNSLNRRPVWMAKGVYKPTQGTDRFKTFALKNGDVVLGGFAGNEDPTVFDLDERDFNANETILSGDLLENDNDNIHYNEALRSDNSRSIVLMLDTDLSANTILDGVTISGANYQFDFPFGGFSLHTNSVDAIMTPQIRNCKFTRNAHYTGGGIALAAGRGEISPTFVNCIFVNNFGTFGGGGSTLTYSQGGISKPIFTNCTFVGNRPYGMYGHLSINGGTNRIEIYNSIFSDNRPNTNGAAKLFLAHSLLDVAKSTLCSNCILFQSPDKNKYQLNAQFVDAANGNYDLKECSPAIDGGDITVLPAGTTLDYNGRPRIFDDVAVDMGAFEYQVAVDPFTVEELLVADNSTGVSLMPEFTITFSEDVYSGTGEIELRKKEDDSVVEKWDASDEDEVTIDLLTATFKTTETLLGHTEYYLYVPVSALTNCRATSFGGIQDAATWNFTTIERDVASIALTETTVDFGTAFEDIPFPEKVLVTFSDNTEEELEVEFSDDGYDGSVNGTYELEGTITLPSNTTNTENLMASAEVTVSEKEINEVAALDDITVDFGTAFGDITFPSTVLVTYNDNTTESLAVTFSDAGYDGSIDGTYELEGAMTLSANTANPDDLVPVVKVIVKKKNIVAITAPDDITVDFGTDFSDIAFPEEVEVTYNDNSTGTLAITFATGTYNAQLAGTYTLAGTITLPTDITNTGDVTVNVNVVVNEKEIVEVEPLADIVVAFATSFGNLVLPQFVEVTYNDNTTELLAVTFANTGYDGSTAGTYTLEGTMTLAANTVNLQDLAPTVDVIVSKKNIVGIAVLDDITVDFGTDFGDIAFPADVTVTYNDNTTESLAVAFAVGPYNSELAGNYDLTGTLTLPADVTNTGGVAAVIRITVNQKEITQVTNPAGVQVAFGTPFNGLVLPQLVEITYNDNSTELVPVTFSNTDYNGSIAGTYTLTGTITLTANTVNPQNLGSAVNVIVSKKNIVAIAVLSDIAVDFGTDFDDIAFPAEVSVTYNDNSTGLLPVTFGNTGYDGFSAGTYTLEGTMTLEANTVNVQNLKPIIDVTVSKKNIVAIAVPEGIMVDFGTDFGDITFPTDVVVTYNDNSTGSLPISFGPGLYNAELAGTYQLPGTLTLPVDVINTGGVAVAISVTVKQREIVEIKSLSDVHVAFGTTFEELALPELVEVLFNDGSQGTVALTFSPGTYDGQQPGSYTLTGTLLPPVGIANTQGLTATVAIIVGNKHVVSVQTIQPITVELGTAFSDLGLPATVMITYSDGTTSPADVNFSEDGYDSTTPGTYQLTGTLLMSDGLNIQQLKAGVDVVVLPLPNSLPTDIVLTNDVIQPDEASFSEIGQFLTADEDANDQHAYALVSGEGDDDNAQFNINGDRLFINDVNDIDADVDVLTIRVMSTDIAGATVEKAFELVVLPRPIVRKSIFIPTVFSPNGDQANDVFRIRGDDVNTITLRIFDSSGRVVFETSEIDQAMDRGWDGTYNGSLLAPGTYTWLIKGTNHKGAALHYKGLTSGNVVLMR